MGIYARRADYIGCGVVYCDDGADMLVGDSEIKRFALLGVRQTWGTDMKKGWGGRFLLAVSLIGLGAWLLHSLFPEMYPLTIAWAIVAFLCSVEWILYGDDQKE